MARSDTVNWIKQPSTSAICSWLNQNMPITFGSYRISDLKKTGLVIIDMVNGFCTLRAGKLAPTKQDPHMEQVIKNVNILAGEFAKRKMEILSFEDCHRQDHPEHPYPLHCLAGSNESKLIPELEWLYEYTSGHIQKDCINPYIGGEQYGDVNEFMRWLWNNGIENLVICGVCTDICVLDFVSIATSLRTHAGMGVNIQDVVVCMLGCSTFDSPEHPRAICQYMGLYQMAARGATLADSIIFPNPN